MAKDATVKIEIRLIDKATGGLNKLSKSAKSLSTNMTSLGKSMTRNVSLPLLAIGTAGIKMAVDLDKSMRNIQAFGGQTEEQIKDLSQTFKDMSLNAENGTQSAQQLADAFFNIQSAGFLGAEGMEVLSVSAKAATAGLTTTQKASEGIMTVLNAYSLTAEDATRVSDLLFTTIKLGVGTFEQLIPTLGDVVPLANAMGIQFDELSAAYVVMSKQGIAFNKAAVQQKAIMTQLLSPGEDLQKQMAALGFSSGQAMVDTLGFLGTLDALADSVGNTSTGIQSLFVNVRAVSGVLALTGKNAEEAAIALAEMQKAGAAQEAFNTQMKSFSAQFSIFKNTLGVFLIDVGEKLLPVLMKVMEAVRGLFAAWQTLDSGVQTVIIAVGAFLAIGGPLLIFFGAIIGAVGTIAGGFTALAGAFGLTAAASVPAAAGVAAVGFSLSGLLIPIAAVAAAIAGIVLLGPTILDFGKSVVQGIGDVVVGAFGGIASGVQGLFNTGRTEIDTQTEMITATLQQFGVAVNETTVAAAQSIVKTGNVTRETLQAIGAFEDDILTGILLNIGNKTRSTIQNIGVTLRQGVQRTINLAKAVDSVAVATNRAFGGSQGGGLGGASTAQGFLIAQGTSAGMLPGISLLRDNNFGQGRNFAGQDVSAIQSQFRSQFGGGAATGGGVSSLLEQIRGAISGPDTSSTGLQQIFDALGGNRVAGGAGSLVDRIFQAVDLGRISVGQGNELRGLISEKLFGGATSAAPSAAIPALAGAGGGDVIIQEINITMPPGTPQEHVDLFIDEIKARLARDIQNRGGNSGRGVTF